jgi:hypothetical protein
MSLDEGTNVLLSTLSMMPMPSVFPTRSRVRRLCVPAIGLLLFCASAWGQIQKDACDLNADGVDNSADVTLAVNMDIGLATCTANIIAIATCNVVVVQRVTNAALGGACSAGSPHTVSLSWTASTTPNVSYNIYRSITSGANYIKIGSVGVGVISYTDTTALAGQTYFYVATAVDSSNNESAFSAPPVQASVTFP